MSCTKHKAKRIFPTLKDCETQEQRIRCFGMFVNTDQTREVVCTECGMTGHIIRSRRGGVRWRTWWTFDEHRAKLEKARAAWETLSLEAPKFLGKAWTLVALKSIK